MPRHKRLEVPGGIYHVIQRGIERRDIFKDDADRKEFLRRMEEALRVTRSKCYGWVLMPNHFHLILRTGVKPLSEVMSRVLTGYALYFNARHKRRGYVYQNRYKSILCQEDAYLLELVRYIHLNPLRARIVNSMDELNRYPWSGHSVLMGRTPAAFQSTGEILERFGEVRQKAVERYRAFIEEAKDMGRREAYAGGGLRRSAGGTWRDVIELRANKEYWRGDERVLGDGDFVTQVLKSAEETMDNRARLKRAGWTIERLIGKVCEETGVSAKDLMKKGRGNAITKAKAILVYKGQQELGLAGSELAKYLQISKQAVSKLRRMGESYAVEHDIKLSN